MRGRSARLSAKHRRVLAQIDERTGLPKWKDVVAMLVALGATVDDSRSGSRVGVLLGEVTGVFHHPHRNFLVQAGVLS